MRIRVVKAVAKRFYRAFISNGSQRLDRMSSHTGASIRKRGQQWFYCGGISNNSEALGSFAPYKTIRV